MNQKAGTDKGYQFRIDLNILIENALKSSGLFLKIVSH